MQRRALLAAAALSAALAFSVGAAAFDTAVPEGSAVDLSDADGPQFDGGGGGAKSDSSGAGGGGGDCVLCAFSARSLVAGLLPSPDPVLLGGVAATVVVLTAAVGLRRQRGDVPQAARDVETGDSQSSEADATTAPPDAAATNDVYRSWLRFEAWTDADDAATPSEHAAAAVEDGVDRDAAARLRDVFRAVRYGDARPSPERERDARSAVDAIEEGRE
ncbi:MAG: DUF4129 domain-containing protein [Halobacterium sp.]